MPDWVVHGCLSLLNVKPESEKVRSILSSLPNDPGVYQYFDEDGKLLYVGKAKNLKKRVSSYFNKDKHQSGKTVVLVRKIADIKFIIVDTEYEALLLENSLIKKHQPRYNINLKDDKTYPWICIKKERFLRIFFCAFNFSGLPAQLWPWHISKVQGPLHVVLVLLNFSLS